MKLSTYLFYMWEMLAAVLMLYVSLLGLAYLTSFGWDVLVQNPLFLSSTLVVFACSGAVIILSIYGIALVLIFLSNPEREILKGIERLKSNQAIEDLVRTLAVKIGVKNPKVQMLKGPPDAFAFGVTDDNVILGLSDGLVETLDKEELETVVLHELYHIKSDVESQTSVLLTEKLFAPKYVTVGRFYLLSVALWAICNWNVVPYVTYLQDVATLRLFLYVVVGGLVFAALFLGVTFILMLKQGALITSEYAYIRELLADGFSSLTSKKPAKLYSAILKTQVSRRSDSNALRRVSFASYGRPQTPQPGVSLSKLIEAKAFSRNMWGRLVRDSKNNLALDNIGFRLSFLNLIERLVAEASVLTVLQNGIQGVRLKPERGLPKAIYDHVRSHEMVFVAFLEYASKNANRFNLMGCSNYLGIESVEALFFLWAAARAKILDFT
jgi:Zn-dependent protease with chaperone function